jgi:hypothetical protein
MAGKKNK